MNTPAAPLGVNRKAPAMAGRRCFVALPAVVATVLPAVAAAVLPAMAAAVLPAMAAAVLLGSMAPAFSADGIEIEVAPPPPRKVAVPPRRPGFVWAPGYYRWDGHRHVWVDGHFIRERPGLHWVPERWYEHHGHYRFVPGHWASG